MARVQIKSIQEFQKSLSNFQQGWLRSQHTFEIGLARYLDLNTA